MRALIPDRSSRCALAPRSRCPCPMATVQSPPQESSCPIFFPRRSQAAAAKNSTLSAFLDADASIHAPGERPFQPRIYKRREFESSDIYGYPSIKEGRVLEFDGFPPFEVALGLETYRRVQDSHSPRPLSQTA